MIEKRAPKAELLDETPLIDTSKGLHAAIEIGSTGIRLIIAEIDAKGNLTILDRASKQSRLGRDVFTMGSISRDGLRETIAILSSFNELLNGYGLQPSDIQVIGTCALR
jgi:exopolyphosphatase/guanosine-5'-triphosphate,3'-diphosphate pyrophosphatase